MRLHVLIHHDSHVRECMEERVKDWAVVHHTTAEQVAGFGFNDGLETDLELVDELDGHGQNTV